MTAHGDYRGREQSRSMDRADRRGIYAGQKRTSPSFAKLCKFLDNPGFRTQKSHPYTNIWETLLCRTYCIPNYWGQIRPEASDEYGMGAELGTPIERFWELYWQCCKDETHPKLYFQENPFYRTPPTPGTAYHSVVAGAQMDFLQYMRQADEAYVPEDPDEEPEPEPEEEAPGSASQPREHTPPSYAIDAEEVKFPYPLPLSPDELAQSQTIDHSCLQFDFDLYQTESTRVVGDQEYYGFINFATGLIRQVLDMGPEKDDDPTLELSAAVMRKPDVRLVSHGTYGQCYKESFHIIIYAKMTKAVKKYIIKRLVDTGLAARPFAKHKFLNPVTEMIDVGSSWHPVCLPWSAKIDSPQAHEFYKLYKLELAPGNINSVTPDDSFQIQRELIPLRPGQHKKNQRYRYTYPRYNLAQELSLHSEARGGYIKKPEFRPREAFVTEIGGYMERTEGGFIPMAEIEDTDRNVTDLTIRDHEAYTLRHILEVLSPKRAEHYNDWFKIINILARENPEYKPLAVYFSQRCPQKWGRDSLQKLEEIWREACTQMNQPGGVVCTVRTLYHWAREDNRDQYDKIMRDSAFAKAKEMVIQNEGDLTDNDLAKLIKLMQGRKYICDVRPADRSGIASWYEFVFGSDIKERMVNDGSLYKWRCDPKAPITLDKFISERLPEFLRTVAEWIDEYTTRSREDDSAPGEDEERRREESQKYYDRTKKKLEKTIRRLGSQVGINAVLARCDRIFRAPGFAEILDTDPNCIGVGNGVLQVYPRTKLIQHYHETPISRSTRVNYINKPFDPNDLHIRTLLDGYRTTFVLPDGSFDEESFTFTMIYLSTSLDGRKKAPRIFIMLGEGAQGKSALIDQHGETLRVVTMGGYGAVLTMDFFTKDNQHRGGPDSEAMLLKNARFASATESEPGATLLMSRIKRMTSDALSASEKHEKQEIFHANCNFVIAANHDPRVTGTDYGTWRRILVYNFKRTFYPKGDARYDPSNPLHGVADTRFAFDFPRDHDYQAAYLRILVHYYELYRDTYHCNLDEVPHARIKMETRQYQNAQDTVSRFLSERMLTRKMLDELQKANASSTSSRDSANTANAASSANSQNAQDGDAVDPAKAKAEEEEEEIAAARKSQKPQKLGRYEKLFEEGQTLAEVSAIYVRWFVANISAMRLNTSDIQKELGRSELKKYIHKNGRQGDFLRDCRILDSLPMPDLPVERVAQLKEADPEPEEEEVPPTVSAPLLPPDTGVDNIEPESPKKIRKPRK